VNVAVRLAASYVTVPATGVVPGPETVKVDVLIDEGSIASLKLAVILPLTATPTPPQTGIVAVTVGFGTLQLVQSEQPVITSASGTNDNNNNHFANFL